jgi:predicted DNA-binding transcriptional regulator AlpA
MNESKQIKIIRLTELSALLNVSPATIWRWRKNKFLPPSISLGQKMIGWELHIIENWISKKREEAGGINNV